MSVSLRKIEYYAVTLSDGENDYNLVEFEDLINSLSFDFIYDDAKSNKMYCLDKREFNSEFISLIFKSGKYNHSPNYISKIDGKERKSDKSLDEGECEKTHIIIRRSNPIDLIVESRRSGISGFQFAKYLNLFIKENKPNSKKVFFQKQLNTNFIENLKSLKRVQHLEVFIDKKILGSNFLNLLEPSQTIKEDIIITTKAKKKKTLAIKDIKKMAEKIGIEGEDVKRIRLKGRDQEGINVMLDSLNQTKYEQIYVELNENGTVNSESFFEKASELL